MISSKKRVDMKSVGNPNAEIMTAWQSSVVTKNVKKRAVTYPFTIPQKARMYIAMSKYDERNSESFMAKIMTISISIAINRS